MKKTPLADIHVNSGGRMVDFAGWYMPVQYSGLREEHDNVRKNVGLFDVSHMGEVRVKGPKALETLEWLTTNDVAKLNDGEAQYSLLPNDQGGLVDDIIVYCLKKNEDYLVCVNASNKDKDFAWMTKNNKGADITDESDMWGQIAIQGPKALELCDRVFGFKVSEMKPFTLKSGQFQNFKIMVATTGYTGEKGCEVFVEAAGTGALWNHLLNEGKDLGAQPIGLGARDTLRTEMKYSLYGHEIDDTTNPYEAGLGWVIKPAKKDFIGKAIIVGKKEAGLQRNLVGFKMLEKGIPRQGYSLFSFDNKEIGKVTSGTHSPTLDEPIGIAYIDVAFAKEGTEFLLDIRGRKTKAVVCKTPFVQK
ncbi:glycine cleavage system protein T [Bdellovibrio bacteriovorus]|uniref:Aminomethyltransferase n=1 Tax=Bdellovibrio bacteriovorus TaxID=959 RepID=A0A161PG75_BDEBC|nr:glycine cleavage system aminomethyltransferase GcvT [Bdellovibrio bacteriovorus]KYG69504.1 glycine cleavage system protein T [Bdellovibrio bacteriovorus]